MDKLQYFIGKVCTLFVHPISRDFKTENPASYPKQIYVYFVGLIDSIDKSGVWMTQLQTSLKTFWKWESVVGIAEEQVLDPNNEKDAEEIKQLKEKSFNAIQKNQNGQYVDPAALSELMVK